MAEMSLYVLFNEYERNAVMSISLKTPNILCWQRARVQALNLRLSYYLQLYLPCSLTIQCVN